MQTRTRVRLPRVLLVTVAIGIIGGLLLVPVNYYAADLAREHHLLFALVVGFWLLSPAVALLTLRVPGSGVLAALVAGLVNVPLGPYGGRSLLTMLMVGAVLELPFMLTLYRRWSRWLLFAPVLAASVLYGFTSLTRLDLAEEVPAVQAAFFVIVAVSAAGGMLLAQVIATRLRELRYLGGGPSTWTRSEALPPGL